MVEEVKQPTPTEEAPNTEATPPVEEPKVDLVTRASQVNIEPQEDKGAGTLEQEAPKFQSVEEAVQWANKKEKEWSSGYGKKFQELADMRKSLEAQKPSSTWTPERIQNELLKDPTFVQAAQSVAQNTTQDEYSALSETDKKLLSETNQKANLAMQQNAQLIRSQQDESLKTKYANYKPEAVDIITDELLTGKVKATREDLWKVYDYDNMAKRAYELGKSDKATDTTQKVQLSSPQGYTAVSSDGIQPEKDESNHNYWNRIVMNNLAKASKETERIRK